MVWKTSESEMKMRTQESSKDIQLPFGVRHLTSRMLLAIGGSFEDPPIIKRSLKVISKQSGRLLNCTKTVLSDVKKRRKCTMRTVRNRLLDYLCDGGRKGE